MVDYGTQYPEAIPLCQTDSQAIAAVLLTIFSRVRIPKEILSDCGANLTSRLIKELQIVRSPADPNLPLPSSDQWFSGEVHSTMKLMLRKILTKFDAQCDKVIFFVYREVPTERAGFSTFEIVYGRKIREPLDILRETSEARETTPVSAVTYVQRVQVRLQEVQLLAGEIEMNAKEDAKV